jgi:hypothetical protein
MVGQPGEPGERIEILLKAMVKISQHKDFLEDAKRNKPEIGILPGGAVRCRKSSP